MNILVCFKVLPDLEQVLGADWDHFSETTDLSYVPKTINCFDESALEIALRMQDALLERGRSVRCTAITVGSAPPASVCTTLFATGFAEVDVLGGSSVEFVPVLVADALAAHLDVDGETLVLTGRQAGFADSGTVPPLLAQRLGLPLIAETETIALEDDALCATHHTDFGRMRTALQLPCVVGVGNSPVSALRTPTLRSKLAVKGRAPRLFPNKTPQQAPPYPNLYRETAEKHCTFLQGETTGQLAAALLGVARREGV